MQCFIVCELNNLILLKIFVNRVKLVDSLFVCVDVCVYYSRWFSLHLFHVTIYVAKISFLTLFIAFHREDNFAMK